MVGAILAGGLGSRLGSPKPTALLRGRPLLEYPLRALTAAGLETVVVAKPETTLPALDVPVWLEPEEPVHPLLGIVTALERADGRAVLVCACDLPFVTPALAAMMAGEQAALVVPRAGGQLHPLLARYTTDLVSDLREALERRAPLQEALAALAPAILDESRLGVFGEPARLLFNVNTPADLARAEQMLDRPGCFLSAGE